jgi:hypothetical protein
MNDDNKKLDVTVGQMRAKRTSWDNEHMELQALGLLAQEHRDTEWKKHTGQLHVVMLYHRSQLSFFHLYVVITLISGAYFS